MMEYKGYIGHVEFDAEAGILHGEVEGIRDVVTFQGASVKEIEKAFHDSVDEYLAYCRELGQEPDKPYSGKFVVRLGSQLHRRVTQVATTEGASLNAWVAERLREAVELRLDTPRVARSPSVAKPARSSKRGVAKSPASSRRG